MEILKEKYTITELSKILNVTDHALRYYEKEFGLKVPKDERGRRYYTASLANIMYQIKNMRDQGLEIKAIKKVLQDEGVIEDIDTQSFYEYTNTTCTSLAIKDNTAHSLINAEEIAASLKSELVYFTEKITSSVSEEVGSVKEYVAKEMLKNKLEIGACVENGLRKLEGKIDKHFEEIDKSLSAWRAKNKKKWFLKIF